MPRAALVLLLLTCLFCATQSGCLLNHTHHTVIRQGEPLRQITFESENARSIFEASAECALADDSDESSSSFGIPFILGLSKSQKTSRTAIRNDVATRFDINGDKHISDYEVSLPK